MQPDLADLQITPDQLERLTGLEVGDVFMGRVCRPSVFRNSRRLLSFLVTELLTLAVILIFCLPLGLVIGRGLNLLSGSSTVGFVSLMLGISLLIFAVWNGEMWRRAKQLKTLAHLLDQVDRHNEIIRAVQIMDELSAVSPTNTPEVIDRAEVLTALRATRESLINGLMTERILRRHQQFMAQRHELFANIETSLITLQHLQIDSQASEYGHLLNEALQIGLSVRRELGRQVD